jgi:hypothetical protein
MLSLYFSLFVLIRFAIKPRVSFGSLRRRSQHPPPRLGDPQASNLQPPTAGNHALGMYGCKAGAD